MAGYRRRHGKPLRAMQRFRRRRAVLDQRLGEAESPADRLAAAYRYLAGAVARIPPHVATAVVEEVVVLLVARADGLLHPRHQNEARNERSSER